MALTTIKYAVGVDGSVIGDGAFRVALTEAKLHKAMLYLIAIVETGLFAASIEATAVEKRYRQLLAWYVHRCNEFEVPSVPLLGSSSNIGSLLCSICAEQGIDCLVVGRRGFHGISRALIGSVSDYVVKNAPCTVLVAKTEPLTDVQQDPINRVVELEEAERQSRIAEAQSAPQHDDKRVVLEAEEAERARRIEERLETLVYKLLNSEEHDDGASAPEQAPAAASSAKHSGASLATDPEIFRQTLNESILALRDRLDSSKAPVQDGNVARSLLDLAAQSRMADKASAVEHGITTITSVPHSHQ